MAAYQNYKGEFLYCFNWIGGGNNSVWAKSKAEARKEIKRQFSSEHDDFTLRRVSQQEADRIDRMNYLATC